MSEFDFSDGLMRMQRHRDAWRGYAYGKYEKPEDFLDGNMVDRQPTEIDRLQAELANLKAQLAEVRMQAQKDVSATWEKAVAEAERKARLEEARWWEHLVPEIDHAEPDCMYCKRIAALSSPQEKEERK